jgi:threonine/homoserine/homoserine lactone efflux protein
MGAAIGDIPGFAAGVAISPIPIIAVILMLFSAKARSNSVSFVLGWLIGLLLAGAVVLAIGLDASEGGASDASGVIKILIGVLFLFLAWKQWSGRPKGDEEPHMHSLHH